MVRRCRQRGLAYLWLLFLVFLLGLGAGRGLEMYATRLQRDKEAELIFVGTQYRQAIALYYRSSPDGQPRFPARLEDLLRDPRSPALRRYLRRLYPDPVTGQSWVPVLAPEGGIQGVRSRSSRVPLGRYESRSPAGSDTVVTYQDWQFVYVPSGAILP